MKFVDEVSITVSSGRGGPGAVSFRREAMTPRGGPDGGDGGRGGHLIFRVNPQMSSLLDFRYKRKFAAANGEPGRGSLSSGADAEDLIIEVPQGTMIRDEEGHLIVDLDTPGDYVFLKGGRGGKGNAFFKTSVNQAPTHAQPGEPGEIRNISLELKLLADVGVIGFPNAGKSTFISVISAAKPKIADYPFTTLVPHLGVVRFDQEKTFIVADIPGLVPGAHQGVGLGTQFLRHIERTNLFVHLIDVSGLSGRDPLQDYHDIMHELAEYDKSKTELEGFRPLMDRPQIVVLNKIDLLQPLEREEVVMRFSSAGLKVRQISAATGEGMKDLVYEMGRVIFESRTE